MVRLIVIIAVFSVYSAVSMALLSDENRLYLLVGLYIGMSVICFAMYAYDKSSAKKGNWRVSENNLHILAVLGGWPGALLGQRLLRHKTVKQPFRFIFWLTVAINCAALFWLLFPTEMQVVLHYLNITK